jgi:hypothetical protein
VTDILEELRGKDPAALSDSTPDELRGKTPDELGAYVEVLDAHLRSIHQDENTGELREKTPDEQKAFDYGLKLRDIAIKKIDEHRAVQEIFRRKPASVQRALANIKTGSDDPYGDVRRLTTAEARDMALRRLDDRSSTMHLDDAEKSQVEKQLRANTDIARRILVTENEHYREAWMKLVTQPHPFLDDDERKAVQAWEEYRAMADFTSASGGYGIPVFIDPSIILTAQGSGTRSCRSPGRSRSTRTGGRASARPACRGRSRRKPRRRRTTARPWPSRPWTCTWPAASSRTRSRSGWTTRRSRRRCPGCSPRATTSCWSTSSPAAPARASRRASSPPVGERQRPGEGRDRGCDQLAGPVQRVEGLGQRFRRNASWLMSVGVNTGVRQLGAANVFHGYTVNLPEGWADQLMGRPVYEDPYMPDTTTTTASHGGRRGRRRLLQLRDRPQRRHVGGAGPAAVPAGHRGFRPGGADRPARLVRLQPHRIEQRQ